MRRATPSDAINIAHLLGSDEESVNLIAAFPWPCTESSVERWIRKMNQQTERCNLSIIEREKEILIGGAGFVLGGSEAVIGYWIGRSFRNQGYAAEAVSELIPLARKVGACLASAHVFPENCASIRVLEKNSFVFQKPVYLHLPQRGGWRKMNSYMRSLNFF